MKEKLQNLITVIFAGIFTYTLFSTALATHKPKLEKPQTFLKFDKKFSGKAFVIDGDSLKVGTNEVRLYDLDAPEYHQNCFDAQNNEYECGKMSRDFLAEFANGKNVECIFAQKDKYDRFLSKCFITNVSINEEIIKNGWAVIYDFSQAEEKMIALEKEAKEKKLGIWRGAFQLPKEYRKSHPRN